MAANRSWHDDRMQRRALPLLLGLLALGLAGIAVGAALAGGGAWVVAFAAGALALWLGDFARRGWPR
jgi:hypothetical protein